MPQPQRAESRQLTNDALCHSLCLRYRDGPHLRSANDTARGGVASSAASRSRMTRWRALDGRAAAALRLRYALGLWFERLVVKSRLRGEARLVRYIDDFVICFQYRSALGEREAHV